MTRTKSTYLAALAVLLSPFAIQVASADPINVSCTDCPISIGPSPQTIYSTIYVADAGTITNLFVDIRAFHTWSGDLIIHLIHGGVSALLFNGSGPANYYGGSYGPLAAFAGAELSGNWTLRMRDRLYRDGGRLYDWRIRGNFERATTSVPEPGTLALFGIALLGMGLARRRKTV